MFDIPIALVVFNRPGLARHQIRCLGEIRPSRLFVIADGARPDSPGEADRVARTRQVVDEIDWECRVTKIYADENLGCGLRIRSGISAAFADVDKLIVLEDDCQPNHDFFGFTKELLVRYENEPRVMAISGTSFHQQVPKSQSYYFSRYAHCWGWATWRRAWNLYDLSACDWELLSSSDRYADLFQTRHEMAYWTHLLDRIAQGKLDTWDVQWMLTCWLNHGLVAAPTVNLVSNVGFGESATHTNFDSPLALRPTLALSELKHPAKVERDRAADAESDRLLFSGTWRNPGIIKSTISRFRRRYGDCRNIQAGRKAA